MPPFHNILSASAVRQTCCVPLCGTNCYFDPCFFFLLHAPNFALMEGKKKSGQGGWLKLSTALLGPFRHVTVAHRNRKPVS